MYIEVNIFLQILLLSGFGIHCRKVVHTIGIRAAPESLLYYTYILYKLSVHMDGKRSKGRCKVDLGELVINLK